MSIEKDVERIKSAISLDDIRVVVREYSAKALKGSAALYSGAVGNLPANDLAVQYTRTMRASIINHVPRGKFLADRVIQQAIEDSAERIFQSQGAGQSLAKKLRNDFLYGDAKAPRNSPASIYNCLWCEASHDFAASLQGDVKVIAVNANPNRVFAQVEIPTALHNPKVRSLGGVPVGSLRATYATHGVEGVLERVQAAYIKEATLAGLLPAAKAESMTGVRRASGGRLHVAQGAARGLGVASVAASAYDGAVAIRQAVRLHEQGNGTGTQSHIVGAASRSVGGLGGFALGASAGAAFTAETGPGAFIGGAVGGAAGAMAGDELAAWMDHRRIYRQADSDGHAWHFDPAHPANGWTRTVTVVGEIPNTQRVVTAPPALADRLDYQASSRAVELALSSPTRAQDPYLQPSTSADHRPGNLYEGDWRRTPKVGNGRGRSPTLMSASACRSTRAKLPGRNARPNSTGKRKRSWRRIFRPCRTRWHPVTRTPTSGSIGLATAKCPRLYMTPCGIPSA